MMRKALCLHPTLWGVSKDAVSHQNCVRLCNKYSLSPPSLAVFLSRFQCPCCARKFLMSISLGQASILGFFLSSPHLLLLLKIPESNVRHVWKHHKLVDFADSTHKKKCKIHLRFMNFPSYCVVRVILWFHSLSIYSFKWLYFGMCI